jgi:hypothetical protein
MSSEATPTKKRKTSDEGEGNDHGGSLQVAGTETVHKARLFNLPFADDITINFTVITSAIESGEWLYNKSIKKQMIFEYHNLSHFSKPRWNAFQKLFDKLNMPDVYLQYNSTKTWVETSSMVKISETVIAGTTATATAPMNQPIMISTNRIPEQIPYTNLFVQETDLTIEKFNYLKANYNNSIHALGDIIVINEETFDNYYYKQSRGLKLSQLWAPQLRTTGGNTYRTIAVLPYHNPYNENSDVRGQLLIEDSNFKLSTSAMEAGYKQSPKLYNKYQKHTYKNRPLKIMTIVPTVDAVNSTNISNGYICMDVKRSLNFTITIPNCSNKRFETKSNIRLQPWTFHSFDGARPTETELTAILNDQKTADGYDYSTVWDQNVFTP